MDGGGGGCFKMGRVGGKGFSLAEWGVSFNHIGLGGEGERGAERFYPVLRGGTNSFRPTIFPFCSPGFQLLCV